MNQISLTLNGISLTLGIIQTLNPGKQSDYQEHCEKKSVCVFLNAQSTGCRWDMSLSFSLSLYIYTRIYIYMGYLICETTTVWYWIEWNHSIEEIFWLRALNTLWQLNIAIEHGDL